MVDFGNYWGDQSESVLKFTSDIPISNISFKNLDGFDRQSGPKDSFAFNRAGN
jgi:hypothetical protein